MKGPSKVDSPIKSKVDSIKHGPLLFSIINIGVGV